ncbi:hypothetical protein C8A01DRAFT_39041 [Parachaetomium inaequale]|uniref:Uncharacterized protein n=1 Tax=Parachaetomium inaequale TaxID=2588326 RepID=A0AAN6PDR5_9PEZI|nr:hypothetical protein C8A01DRAFT_39041 [Parachaetomium inaequale]
MKFTLPALPLLAALALAAPNTAGTTDIGELTPDVLALMQETTAQAMAGLAAAAPDVVVEKRAGLEHRYNHCSKCSSHGSMICTNCSVVRFSYLCFTQAIKCKFPSAVWFLIER